MIRHTARCQRPISALSRWAPGGRFHSGSQLTLQLKQPIEVDGPPPRTLVKDLDFKLQAGERWAILGPNGSGKSTIARTLLERWEKAHGASTAYVSFDLQRHVLQDERRDFLESRYETRHLRATVSSFLFPELHPDDPDYDPATSGFRPPRTRVSPLPVPYDADASHPLLEKLETASSSGKAARLLHFFGLWQLRHRPLFALSTGEGRKLLMVDALLKEPSLLILDEAFDGLDKSSRVELASMLESFFDESPRALVMIVHRLEDLVPLPSSVLLLGQGDGTEHSVGPWSQMEAKVTSFLQDSSSHAEAIEIAKKVVEGVKVGKSADSKASIGPLASQAQWERVQGYIQTGIKEGANLVAGGPGRPEGLEEGFFVKPTIFADVDNKMTIAQEEIFGPVLSIIPYNSEEEAIRIANDTVYGLNNAVGSASPERAMQVARKLRSGMVMINDTTVLPDAPFGGYKQSGNAREWGTMGIEEYLVTKTMAGKPKSNL